MVSKSIRLSFLYGRWSVRRSWAKSSVGVDVYGPVNNWSVKR